MSAGRFRLSQDPSSRRQFLQAVALSGTALAAAAKAPEKPAGQPRTMMGVAFDRHATVRIGLIGAGARGQSLLRDLLRVPAVEIRAVCDTDPQRQGQALKQCAGAGRPAPAVYGKDEQHFEALCAREDLDLLYIATPWEWHAPMALCGMRNGKHVGVEVPAGVSMAELWELVRTSERTRRHCMMLENCCYGDNEMMVLAMVQAGLFGTLTHAEAAYIHDLRTVMNERGEAGGYVSEARWRRAWHTKRNGNLYPTHGLGPVCWYLGIHRGDRLESLVSLSSLQAALGEDQDARFQGRGEAYVCGDMNSSLLRTARGRTILLQHDVVTPRPYSRHNLVQGSRGAFANYPSRLFLDDVARRTGSHRWIQGDDLKPYRERYVHELWKRVGDVARQTGGHGGMDYIMSYRLIECLREGLAPDFNVYDAAAWSAPFPLSVASVQAKGMPQAIPDFTRGHWGA